MFERNLGVATYKATIGITAETDSTEVATFYIASPGNSWIGNVAAGSENFGFHFRLKQAATGDYAGDYPTLVPYRIGIVEFESNVVHSSFFMGIKTFPVGYNPISPQTFSNTRVFRNRGQGIWIVGSRNLILDGGVVADNRYGIESYKSDSITIRNFEIIGQTDLYRSLSATVAGTPKICTGFSNGPSVAGIRVHPNKRMYTPGVTIENTYFSGFTTASGCEPSKDDTAALAFVHTDWTMTASFTTTVTLTDLSFEDGSTSANEVKLCTVEAAGVYDIIIADTNGSLNPSGTEPGTIISLDVTCDGTTTLEMPGSCAKYCVGGTAPGGLALSSTGTGALVRDPSAIPDEVANSLCIENGSFETSSSNDISPWYAAPHQKATGITALGYGGTGLSGLAKDRTHQARGGLYQVFRTNCLTANEWFEVKADIRVMEENSQTPFECDPEIMWYDRLKSCPAITILVDPATNDRIEAAPLVGPLNTEGEAWNKLSGIFYASDEMMAKAYVQLFVAGARNSIDIYLDNVALNTVSAPYECSSPVLNGDFESGDFGGWFIRGMGEGGHLEMISPGADGTGSAIRHTNRPRLWHGILQRLPIRCFTVGSSWEVSAKFRVYDSNGSPVSCTRNTDCPAFELGAAGVVLSGPFEDIETGEVLANDVWNSVRGNYTIPESMMGQSGAAKNDMWLTVNRVPENFIYDIDDIVLTKLE